MREALGRWTDDWQDAFQENIAAQEMEGLVNDHREIFTALSQGDAGLLGTQVRAHLSRIGKTIAAVHESHPEYFVG